VSPVRTIATAGQRVTASSSVGSPAASSAAARTGRAWTLRLARPASAVPVQILEDQHQGPPRAEPAQQAENQLEKLGHLDPVRGRLGCSARVEFGQQPPEAAPGRAEHLGQLARRRRAG